MCKQIDNKKLLQDVHVKNQTVREKVELQEAVALVEQTLAEYVENSLSDVIHELEYREDIMAISSAWELIKIKIEESKNANA